MHVTALSSFRRRDNKTLARRGETLIVDEKYGAELCRVGLAVDPEGKHKRAPRKVVALTPPENAAKPGAPETAAVPPSSAGGVAQPSSASPPARRSRSQTAKSSGAGTRRKPAAE